MSGENGERENDKQSGVWGETGEDDREDDEDTGDGVATSKETFASAEEASNGKSERGEADKRA